MNPFDEDAEIQALLSEIRSSSAEDLEPIGAYTQAKADQIKSLPLDRIEFSKEDIAV